MEARVPREDRERPQPLIAQPGLLGQADAGGGLGQDKVKR